jgi:dipeptidyl aminopeptidase/acylaminoacyl peptidase
VGFSRSGYLTYYIATHPGRTKLAAAVVHDSLTAGFGDYINAAALGDERSVYERQYGQGTFWQNKAAWMDAPVFNLDRLSTPILFSATGQGASNSWTALETVGAFHYTRRPFDFLYLPQGAHALQRPREREAAMQATLDWMIFWIKGDVLHAGDRYERWRKIKADWEATQAAESAAQSKLSDSGAAERRMLVR